MGGIVTALRNSAAFLMAHREILVIIGMLLFIIIVRTIVIAVKYAKRRKDIEIEIQRAPTHAERNYWIKCKKELWKMFFFG